MRELEALLVGTIVTVKGVFCVCGVARSLLAFGGRGTARQPARLRKRIIASTVTFKNGRRITVDAAARFHSSIAGPVMMRKHAPAARVQRFVMCAPKSNAIHRTRSQARDCSQKDQDSLAFVFRRDGQL